MKKSNMKLSKACDLITLMPKISASDVTKEECIELWEFLNTDKRLSMTQHMLKIKLADECGVFVDNLIEAMDDKPLCEVLSWEAGDTGNDEIELIHIMNIMRNAHAHERHWILDLCFNLSAPQCEFVWRWALNYRWNSIRNIMVKWLDKESKLNETYDFDTKLSVIYDGLDVGMIDEDYEKLEAWASNDVPEKYWFVTDCSTLMFVKNGIVRWRNGKINTEYSIVTSKDNSSAWVWENPKQTGLWCSEDTGLSFATYKEPLDTSWIQSRMLLESYAKGGFLIHHKNKYYLLTSGTNTLYAQVMTVQNLDKGGYEFVIGFVDGSEVVDTTTLVMELLPFELESALKRRKVYPNIRHAFHPIEDCLVVKLNFTWTVEKGWHIVFDSVEDSYGIDNIDDIAYFYSIVGDDYE